MDPLVDHVEYFDGEEYIGVNLSHGGYSVPYSLDPEWRAIAIECQKRKLVEQLQVAHAAASTASKMMVIEGGMQVTQVITSCKLCHSDTMGSYGKGCDNETCLGLSDEEWAWKDIDEWWMNPKDLPLDDFDRLDTAELEKRVWRALTNPPRHPRTQLEIS